MIISKLSIIIKALSLASCLGGYLNINHKKLNLFVMKSPGLKESTYVTQPSSKPTNLVLIHLAQPPRLVLSHQAQSFYQPGFQSLNHHHLA